MPDFLLELRTEEIPARMQAGARRDLEKAFREHMAATGVTHGAITVWSTPRRLALIARGLPEATEAQREEIKGPKVGAPPQAMEGFLRKVGQAQDRLEERGGTYFAIVERPGRATSDILAWAIVAIVRTFHWPKAMRWGAASISTESPRWVRPLSGIVAILGEELVECTAAGVSSGYATLGHRFHAPGPITIGGANDYAAKLRACHVIVDHAERETLIRDKAHAAAAQAGLVLVEDEGLVIENAGLTEWPVPLLGRFDAAFLEVPPEVIQLTARTNQKYFVCHDADSRLANAFVCTANIDAADGGAAIVDGNRKVLAARLSDARFFWEQDRRKTLAQHAEKLANIVFHEKLGTVADKVERVAKLARWLVEEGIVKSSPSLLGEGDRAAGGVEGQTAQATPPSAATRLPPPRDKLGEDQARLANLAEQAARLCKADLVTEMVGEFPELQGLIGGYYARAEGLPEEVADAIRDHYKPVGQGDAVPTAPVTLAVSLADKLDTLVGFFAIDQKPSGSKDPFALRRTALGILRLVTVNNVRLSLRDAIREAYWQLLLTSAKQRALIHFPEGSPEDQLCTQISADETFRADGMIAAIAFDALPLTDSFLDGAPAFSRYDIDEFVEVGATIFWFSGLVHTVAELMIYLSDRLIEDQRRYGVRHDLIGAVVPKEFISIDVDRAFADLPPRTRGPGVEKFRIRNWKSPDDPVEIVARVHALQAFVGTRDGVNLLAGYKRAANILKKENYEPIPVTPAEAGVQRASGASGEMDSGLRRNDGLGGAENYLSYTPEPAERALMDALDAAEPTARDALAAEDFAAAMSALATLRGPIDVFFDAVTVNDADPAKRAARLALLARFRGAVHQVADFSKIEG